MNQHLQNEEFISTVVQPSTLKYITKFSTRHHLPYICQALPNWPTLLIFYAGYKPVRSSQWQGRFFFISTDPCLDLQTVTCHFSTFLHPPLSSDRPRIFIFHPSASSFSCLCLQWLAQRMHTPQEVGTQTVETRYKLYSCILQLNEYDLHESMCHWVTHSYVY